MAPRRLRASHRPRHSQACQGLVRDLLPVFSDLAIDPATGVSLRPANFYFRRPIVENPAALAKMEELATRVTGFRHDAALIEENGINPGIGLCDAYAHISPMVDTDVYMRWLLDQCHAIGCRTIRRGLSGPIRLLETALADEFDAEVIVNCTGLGAAELAEDAVRPLRGALVRVRNDGRSSPRITQAHCVTREAEDGFVFVLPRGDSMLVLGGIAELGESGLGIGLDNYEPVQDMYQRCIEFLPTLRDAEIDIAEPVRVGLRPFRAGHVRLERSPQSRIVHNYGHGGSGVTYSWECALEVVELVRSMVQPDARRTGARRSESNE